jgi:CHAT domain-containing protein
MRSICSLLAAVILLSSPGSSVLRTSTQKSEAADWGPPQAQAVAREAYRLLSAGRLEEAAALFEKGYSAAVESHSDSAAIRFLTALAGCRFAQFRYRDAIQAYSRAQSKALEIGDYRQAGLNALNASSVYAQLEDVRGAGQAAADALHWLSRADMPDEQAQVLLQLGWVASLENRNDDATRLYRRAIQFAKARRDTAAEAFGWHRLGAELLDQGHLTGAEQALNQAYRLRLESHDPRIEATYRNLAELKLAQGDYTSAEQLANKVIALPASLQHVPAHRVYYLRGAIRLAKGDLQPALDDFRSALRDAEHWSAQVPPADSFRISAESMLAELYSAQIQCAAELYFSTHDPQYAAESWQAAEGNRAASLRAQILSANHDRLPPEYWETLAQLHSIESRLVAADQSRTAALEKSAEALRFRLTNLEMAAGISSRFNSPENFLTRISLRQFRRVLGNSRRFVSFHLGDKTSYRWVIEPSGIDLQRLPGREEITQLAERFRAEVERNNPAALATGGRLYTMLFRGISLTPRHWLVALDGTLFETPLAALVLPQYDSKPVYLAEQVTLETVPGAWAVGAAPETAHSGPFLGLGDPIYNVADERLRPSERRALAGPAFFNRRTATLEFPRLAGSAAELTECARQWTGNSFFLTGDACTAARFRDALASRPSVIHIAAHFVGGGDDENRTVIALSLHAGAKSGPAPEVLTAADISTMRADGATVVLSGCGSGLGRVQEGAGLLGLARAWLAAGAVSVVSSEWPVPDDAGYLFQSFYRQLNEAARTGAQLSAADALRRAQIEMLHSQTWRSSPSYWAAYGLLGRSN